MGMEIGKINAGIVTSRKPLAVLLEEEVPSAMTKSEERYYFDRGAIIAFGEKLPRELHARLKLPILFFLSPDVPDSCSCSDEATFYALRHLGEISAMRTVQGGTFWVARPIVYAILKKYPTVVQIAMRA
jgi:hypothetical protein